MAKQRRRRAYTGMGATLVAGAGDVYRSQNQAVGVDLQSTFSGIASSVQQAQAQKRAALDAEEAKAANYLGQMEAMDTGIVPMQYRDKVENSLQVLKNEYYETAMQLKGLKTSDPDYMNLSSKLNNVNNSIRKISSTFADLNKNKKEDLEFIAGKNYSEGNNPGTIGFLNNVLTGQANMDIDASGNVYFDNNGQWTSYENMPDMISYDGQSFGKVLTQLDNVRKYKRQLTDTDKTSLRSQMMNLLKTGGRDTAISLGSDDFIVPGGMGLGGSEAFDADPNAYRKKIVESYMGLFEQAANEGYNEYQQTLSAQQKNDPKAWQIKLMSDANVAKGAQQYAKDFFSKGAPNPNLIIQKANSLVKQGNFDTGLNTVKNLIEQNPEEYGDPTPENIKKYMKQFNIIPDALYLNQDINKAYPIGSEEELYQTLLRLNGISPKREMEVRVYTGGGSASGDSIFS